jgi:hypothetical protein
MHLYRCRVNHAGNRDMQIHREEVTPAEIVILQTLHGADSISNIEKVREKPVRQEVERKRLADTYGSRVFARLFPGARPMLPLTLAEAGLSEDGRSLEQIEAESDPPEPEVPETPAAPLPAAVAEKVRRVLGPGA